MSTLLPPASTGLERAAEQVIDARIGDLPEPIRALWSPQDCPEHLLPWLAWALSVDQWSPDWPVAIRRARVASAIEIQRIKGTRRAIERVVASFGGGVAIREWFETTPPGDPHTFQLIVALGSGGAAPAASLVDAVIAEVQRAKPARSHFTFAQAVNAAGSIGLVAAARPIAAARIAFETQPDIWPPDVLTFAGNPLTLGGEFLTVGS